MITKLCRPLLVETKQPTNIFKDNSGLFYSDITQTGHSINSVVRGYELILISLEDENIEEGDLKYNSKLNTIWKHNRESKELPDNIKHITSIDTVKVIATQEQLSQEYIKQFVEEYNKGEVKDINIETEEIINYRGEEPYVLRIYPKLNNGFVNIIKPKIELTKDLLKGLLDKSRPTVKYNTIEFFNRVQLAKVLLAQIIEEEREFLGDKYEGQYDELYNSLADFHNIYKK